MNMHVRYLLLGLGLSIGVTCVAAPPAEWPHVDADVVYKTTEQGDLFVDLYYPEAKRKGPYPLVIYTHGGGWAAGSRKGAVSRTGPSKVVHGLAAQGFCVASVEYRLCNKEEGISVRDCVIDSKDALRFLAKHADRFSVDPERVFTFGDSAGGQIAQMLLLSSPESLPGDDDLRATPYRMIAGVSWYGPCDFERTELFNPDGRPNFRDRFGPRILKADTPPSDKRRLYREMSPVNYLESSSPPLLMLQGDGDTTIPVHHAHYMKERAEKISAPVEIRIVKNTGHNWRNAGTGPSELSKDEIAELSVDFLHGHLRKLD